MTWEISGNVVQAHAGPVPEHCLFPIRGAGFDSLDGDAKHPGRKARSSRRATAVASASPVPVTECTPASVPVHEEEVADGALA